MPLFHALETSSSPKKNEKEPLAMRRKFLGYIFRAVIAAAGEQARLHSAK